MSDIKLSIIKSLLHAGEALVILGIAWLSIRFLPLTPELSAGIAVGAGSFVIKLFRDMTGRDYINVR